FGTHLNGDFRGGFPEDQPPQGGIEYNYQREPAWQARSDQGMATRMGDDPVAANPAGAGPDVATYTRERPGMSAFAIEDGVLYHTYSTYARGLDALWSMYPWLDRTPKGRNGTGMGGKGHGESAKP